MPNVLVTGSKGQVGSELRMLNDEFLTMSCQCFFTDRGSLDIGDKESIKEFVEKNDINIIINTAAYTAVDKAEEDKEKANLVNHIATKHLAEIAKEYNVKLIHISTDYVFDGKNFKPYTEDDATNPQGVYGKTKLDGENVILNINPKNTIIIRTSWVYSSFGNNFVKTMLRLGKERDKIGVIFDQVGTPTYAKDLASTILQIIQYLKFNIRNSVEVYHYSNEGVCSWYDFTKTIFKITAIKCKINPIETKDYPTLAIRPNYTLLNKAKIKKDFNITIPYWKDSLNECLHILGEKN